MIHADLLIRRAQINDAPEVMALIQRAMTVYAQKSGISFTLESLKETEADIIKHIEQDYVMLAQNKDGIVGTVRLIVPDPYLSEEDTAYFSRFAVIPQLQQTGVGRLLYQAAEDYLRSVNIRSIRLHTSLKNLSLVAFYQSRGFQLTETDNSRGYPRGCFEKKL